MAKLWAAGREGLARLVPRGEGGLGEERAKELGILFLALEPAGIWLIGLTNGNEKLSAERKAHVLANTFAFLRHSQAFYGRWRNYQPGVCVSRTCHPNTDLHIPG